MQSATTVLEIIRARGERGAPLHRVYRLLFNRDLFLMAYGRIARNAGALTRGATADTADGMSLAKIDAIIEALRFERYRWTPVRRVHIPKPNGKRRPLGLPIWSDKLVQEVLRLILEAYYDPQFSTRSHGFRRNRGCHTALREVHRRWTGTVWFIEADIAQYFDRLDHTVLLAILREKIHDGRFLGLIAGLLRAGYLDEVWRFNRTLSGVPQGGVVSPLLANIYLDRLDQWVETTLVPQYTRGTERALNRPHIRLMATARRRDQSGQHAEARRLRQQARRLPSHDPTDPHYRRLRYVRYADDFLLGFAGPRSEAEEIQRQLGAFLRETLKLELAEEKTLITHGRTQAAHFLGYDVHVLHNDAARDHRGHRAINGGIGLRVPLEVRKARCARLMARGKAVHRPELLADSVFSTVARYQQQYRGLVNYYRLAYNLYSFSRLKWVMETSLTKTLARKLRISVTQVYRRYRARIQTPYGPYKGLRVTVERAGKAPLVAEWGGIPLRRNMDEPLNDSPDRVWNDRSELEQRLLAEQCELCGARTRLVVHHIRALRDLERPGRTAKPAWVVAMATRHRKTLVVCPTCHWAIHTGRPTANRDAA